eukprot:scaffold35323_cov56-Attheya_sp.AAC.1
MEGLKGGGGSPEVNGAGGGQEMEEAGPTLLVATGERLSQKQEGPCTDPGVHQRREGSMQVGQHGLGGLCRRRSGPCRTRPKRSGRQLFQLLRIGIGRRRRFRLCRSIITRILHKHGRCHGWNLYPILLQQQIATTATPGGWRWHIRRRFFLGLTIIIICHIVTTGIRGRSEVTGSNGGNEVVKAAITAAAIRAIVAGLFGIHIHDRMHVETGE